VTRLSFFRIAAGFVLAFLVGAGARWIKVPVPAPPTFIGAFLIVAITAGYISMDEYLQPDPSDRNGPSVQETKQGSPENGDAKD
jgi:XapX domain-containing protein